MTILATNQPPKNIGFFGVFGGSLELRLATTSQFKTSPVFTFATANNIRNHLEQYKEKFTVINEDHLITATSVNSTDDGSQKKQQKND